MRVTFWGVRGSIPTPGPETSRWGGNSSCIEVTHGAAPPLVLDCGTGGRALGHALVGRRSRELDLLITHFHLDHVFGFPFFLPIYTPGYEVRVSLPAFSEDEAREKLSRFVNGIYHPTRLREVPAKLSFRAMRSGRSFVSGPWSVHALSLNHPGGSLGYRIEAGGQRLAYITDTAPFARPGEGVAAGRAPVRAEARVLEFLANSDLVIYDTMYDREEYLEKMTWGHSYPEYAAAVCRAAGVKRLALFHHLPDASDEDLDALADHWAACNEPVVVVAREGDALDVAS